MEITKNMLPKSKYNIKAPYMMTPEIIVVHNTANDASARNEIAYMIGNDNQVSFHYAIDDKEVVQGVPENRNTWNAGDGSNGRGNRKGIAIEICYSKSGGKRFTDAEKLAAKFIAFKLKEKGWGIDKVMKHQDFNGKGCPHRTLQIGWKRFLDMIVAEMGDTYIVKKGDVLWKIAEKYDLTWQELAKHNNLNDTQASNLKIGQVLSIPDKNDLETPDTSKELLECHNTKIELTNEIDTLKQEIKVYKGNIDTLEHKISDLKSHNDELKEEIKNIPEFPKFIFKSQRTSKYIINLPKGIELYIKKD